MKLKTMLGISLASAIVSAIVTSVSLSHITALSDEEMDEILEEKTKKEEE